VKTHKRNVRAKVKILFFLYCKFGNVNTFQRCLRVC